MNKCGTRRQICKERERARMLRETGKEGKGKSEDIIKK
jgi:hypothetical protein